MDTFLGQAGFLHVSGVFTEDEMAAVSADMDRAAPSYAQGDGRSWWARTDDGADRLVRMQGFDAMSPTAAALVADGRLARLGALTGDGHEWGGMDSNALEALVKPIGVVEGISDVPWHKDCSLGRHSYECCSLTVGISVTGADETSGQLKVVAGSHRALMWPAFLRRDNALPVVDLPTRTGDVTVHLSCTMHMAQPPVERERRVMYTGFRLAPAAARRRPPRRAGVSGTCARPRQRRCRSLRAPCAASAAAGDAIAGRYPRPAWRSSTLRDAPHRRRRAGRFRGHGAGGARSGAAQLAFHLETSRLVVLRPSLGPARHRRRIRCWASPWSTGGCSWCSARGTAS